MNFYIASALQNAKLVFETSQILKNLGHTQSYDWTIHGDVRDQGAKKLKEVALLESNAVIDSDLVLVLLPGMRGTHTEIGMAIASARINPNKKIWLWCKTGEHFEFNSNTCAFYFHRSITRFTGDFSQVIAELQKQNLEKTT